MSLKRLPPPPKSNKQVQEYVRAVERGRNSYFVVQNDKGWHVKKASDRRHSNDVYPSKAAAIKVASSRAARHDSQILIFNHSGRLIDRKS